MSYTQNSKTHMLTTIVWALGCISLTGSVSLARNPVLPKSGTVLFRSSVRFRFPSSPPDQVTFFETTLLKEPHDRAVGQGTVRRQFQRDCVAFIPSPKNGDIELADHGAREFRRLEEFCRSLFATCFPGILNRVDLLVAGLGQCSGTSHPKHGCYWRTTAPKRQWLRTL